MQEGKSRICKEFREVEENEQKKRNIQIYLEESIKEEMGNGVKCCKKVNQVRVEKYFQYLLVIMLLAILIRVFQQGGDKSQILVDVK